MFRVREVSGFVFGMLIWVHLPCKVSCKCKLPLIDFLVNNFKRATYDHDIGIFEKIVTCSYRIIITIPAFLKMKSAFFDKHFFQNHHGNLS